MTMDGQTKKEPPFRELWEMKMTLDHINILMRDTNERVYDIMQLVERSIIATCTAVVLLVGLVIYESGFSM